MEYVEVSARSLAVEPEPSIDDRPSRQVLPEAGSAAFGERIRKTDLINRTAVYVIRMHGGVGGGAP